jgi:hypothetical protein
MRGISRLIGGIDRELQQPMVDGIPAQMPRGSEADIEQVRNVKKSFTFRWML